MSGAQLPGADLRWAELTGADLFDAQLPNADLSEANLPGADLFDAQLPGADLFNAQLPGADLFNAQLPGANLFNAQLPGANLFNAQLPGAVLLGAQLPGADLRGAQLPGADLRGAQLPGAMLIDLEYLAMTNPAEIAQRAAGFRAALKDLPKYLDKAGKENFEQLVNNFETRLKTPANLAGVFLSMETICLSNDAKVREQASCADASDAVSRQQVLAYWVKLACQIDDGEDRSKFHRGKWVAQAMISRAEPSFFNQFVYRGLATALQVAMGGKECPGLAVLSEGWKQRLAIAAKKEAQL
jgi:uncharacterized protein YjbI with pentapeptide repeats